MASSTRRILAFVALGSIGLYLAVWWLMPHHRSSDAPKPPAIVRETIAVRESHLLTPSADQRSSVAHKSETAAPLQIAGWQEQDHRDGLDRPPVFLNAADYMKSPQFNQTGVELALEELEPLEAMLQEAQRKLTQLMDQRNNLVLDLTNLRFELGLYESVEEEEIKPTPGEITTFRTWSDGRSGLVRLRRGEDAALDVVHDDMWSLVASAHSEIRDYFKKH